MKSRIESLLATVTGCTRSRVFLLLTALAMVASDANASTIIRWGNNGYLNTSIPAGLTNAVEFAATASHVVSRQANGTVLDWGSFLPSEAAAVADAKAVAVADRHSLLLRSNGLVVAWGTGTNGENTVPAGLNNVVGIAAGAQHNLAVKSDGTVTAWGNNGYGQCDVPPGLSNVVAVDANGDSYYDSYAQFSVALKSDGTVVVWGLNHYNFFGINNVPAEATNVVAISGAGNHMLALKGDGTVVAWGDNRYNEALPPAGLSNVVSICAGRSHNLALKSDGHVVAWGNNFDPEPLRVPTTLSNVIAIACGQNFSLALVEASPPVIMVEPVGLPYHASGEDSFRIYVVAQGPPPLTYQWYQDGNLLAGKTNADWRVFPTLPAQGGTYTCTISNPFGSVTTTPAGFVILPNLVITVNPQSQTVNSGQNVTMVSHAKGSQPISYQWLKDGIILAGATNETLTLNNAQTFNSGKYRASITNIYTNYYTAEATLLVINTNGPTIQAQPQSDTVFAGARFAFSVAATSTNGPLSYQWRKGGSNLGGQTGSQLLFSSVQVSDEGSYNVVVTAGGISTTSAVASLTVTSHTFTFATTGAVVSLGGAAVPPGLNNVVSIAAGGHGVALRSDGMVVQWGSVGSVPNVPAGLSNVVAISAAGNHTLVLRSDGTVVSWAGYTPFGDSVPKPPTNLFGVIGIAAGPSGGLAIKADHTVVKWGWGPPVPGVLNNATAVAAGFFWDAVLKADGTVFIWGEPGFSIPYLIEPPTSLVAIAATHGSHFMGLRSDGTVVDYRGGGIQTNNAPAGLSNVIAISASTESLALLANGSVVGWNGASLPANLGHIQAIAAGQGFALVLSQWPVITQHPQSLTVNEGAIAAFNLGVGGTSPLTIQWQKNGANISGATNTNFTIATATPADLGDYRAIISNNAGSVTSLVATLNMNTLPVVIQQPRSENLFVGARVVLTSSSLGALPLYYQWRRNNVNLTGETNATLSISQIEASGGGSYTLVVSNSYGAVTSAVATVNVTAYTFTWSPPGTVVGLDGPMVPTGLTNAVAIAFGGSYGMALRNDGTVVEWNTNHLPAGLTDVIAISASQDGRRALALRSDGTVVAGNTTPAPVDLFGVVAIAAGTRNNLALKVDGTLVSWGALTAPAGLSNVVAIAAAYYNAALKSDGTAVIWGTYDGFNLPVNPNSLVGADDLVAIAAGDDEIRGHVMALRSDGTVLDYFGGDNTPTNAAPSSLSDVVAIAAGEHLSLALKSDGTIVRWNAAPAPEGISNVTAIAAGGGASLLIVSENPPMPMLAAGRENGQFTLSTPISVSGYTLETVTNFSQVPPPSGVSSNVMTFEGGGGPSAGQNNAAAMMFFRLRKTD